MNDEKFQKFLNQYKEDLKQNWWEKEKYKWEAVKTFNANWEIESNNFKDKLQKSLSGAKKLLIAESSSESAYDKILEIAEKEPEELREIFEKFFDDKIKNVYGDGGRMHNFNTDMDSLSASVLGEEAKHRQEENIKHVYLSLMFPEKYYFFNKEAFKKASEEIDGGFIHYDCGLHKTNREKREKFCDDINKELKKR